jgi:hypothetical protein
MGMGHTLTQKSSTEIMELHANKIAHDTAMGTLLQTCENYNPWSPSAPAQTLSRPPTPGGRWRPIIGPGSCLLFGFIPLRFD